jgi:hypothetical protein
MVAGSAAVTEGVVVHGRRRSVFQHTIQPIGGLAHGETADEISGCVFGGHGERSEVPAADEGMKSSGAFGFC